jgi:predicted adenine nucleotide alpha hydrolase (AANH) superfamily ATPase
MNKINYQKQLEEVICNLKSQNKKSLLLHSCCAPCSTYVIKYLAPYFNLTVFYYNPNIYPESEYLLRISEQKRFISMYNKKINFIEGDYNTDNFYNCIRGCENTAEGGARCTKCFKLRLKETAEFASFNNFDYFGTTLTVSPHKNADIINSIGKELGKACRAEFLPSDFKKKEGYKKSIELSKKYNLYRQAYCGCEFSKPL